MRKRKRRTSDHHTNRPNRAVPRPDHNEVESDRIISGHFLFFEAWNLGFLNPEAETTIERKSGGTIKVCYREAVLQTRFMQESEDTNPLFTTPYIAPLIRMIYAYGMWLHMPDSLPQSIDREGLFKLISESQEKGWYRAINILLKSGCPLLSFQDILEIQSEHFFKEIKSSALSLVKVHKENPCPCCPQLTFDIVESPDGFLNRSDTWQHVNYYHRDGRKYD